MADYTYTKIAVLGETAPGGAQYFFDFEVGLINRVGDVIYGADLTTDGSNDIGEGVFLLHNGQASALILPEQPAPGGGTFDGAFFGPPALNEQGDGAIIYQLNPFILPLGMNAGVYRYAAAAATLTAVMVPGVTKAPRGGRFQGAFIRASINNLGDIVFAGIVPTTAGISGDNGMGVFKADSAGHISSVVMPGDKAPGGGKFDFAENPWINDVGDVAFGAHIAGEECIGDPTLQNQDSRIFCGESVYLSQAARGTIISIAHQGDPAPGGGVFRHAWGPIANNLGQVLFVGDLTPPPNFDKSMGLYLFNGSVTTPVVRPGDHLPGGALVTVSDFISNYHLNNRGEVSFSAKLSTGQEGLYVKSGSSTKLVAKTGAIIPGVGEIANFDATASLNGGSVINDQGQVLFGAVLRSGGAVLLIATPTQ